MTAIKKYIWWIVAAIVIICAAAVLWRVKLGATRIAFVNFQTMSFGHIAKANDNNFFIKIDNIDASDIEKAIGYDMVFVNGMGLKITEAQREAIQEAAGRGLPVLTAMVTNPANNIMSVDSVHAEAIKDYLRGGGRENYRNMLLYVRKYIDKKWLSAPTPAPATERKSYLLYHADPKNADAEELGFNSVAEYHKWLAKNGLWKDNAPRIIVTGIMGNPSDLVGAFEKLGNVGYIVDDLRSFIADEHIDSVRPSAVINLAHGRLGDAVVAYLEKQNIPFFAPINTQHLEADWEADKMGLSGGYLGQTVTMPEIDGALLPYSLFAHYKDDEGLLQVFAMPQRLETFASTVMNYIGLKSKANKDKRIAVFYYKGPGQSALAAQGMEVVPSLYAMLLRLRSEGYDVQGLPSSAAELERLIMQRGAILGSYAEGAMDKFLSTAQPELISKADYEAWVKTSLRPEKYKEVVDASGEFPGRYLATADGKLGIPRLQFGNVVLLPQMPAGVGGDEFKMVHGTDAAPPHFYLAQYLWVQHGFKADALIHFGTHGSLEFTPDKQVALSSLDWGDRLVGALPHFYIYSIGNVGEAIIAKRRSYASLQSYLTAPFMESNVRSIYRELEQKINAYNALVLNTTVQDQTNGGTHSTRNNEAIAKASLAVKELAVKIGLHRELGLDSVLTQPYSEEDVARVENFAEELATEKINGEPYVYGTPYSEERITSSVYAMATEPLAYSLLALDKQRKKVSGDVEKHRTLFTARYLNPARATVTKLLANPNLAGDALVCSLSGLTPADIAKADKIYTELTAPRGGMMAAMPVAQSSSSPSASQKPQGGHPHAAAPASQKPQGGHPHASMNASGDIKVSGRPGTGSLTPIVSKGTNPAMAMGAAERTQYTSEEKAFANAVMELRRTVNNVAEYRRLLRTSPERELSGLINALGGGYTSPSPGGDPIANPNSLPTGRNMYAINAEATPTEAAWEKGKQLAKNTLDLYRRRHNDSLPHKVSYTFWSSEFIETEGATLAQAMYMLGVEPIRDAFGRVNDLRLIPSKELGRPRIDIVVQTSGQLRDLAASRLFLLQRAVEMAANAKDDDYTNEVHEGVVASEQALIDKGLSPKQARELSVRRVFGGINGNYGTGIQEMVMASGRWTDEKQIAEVYLNNMGAFYGDEKKWEEFQAHAFEAALTRTDVVIQPRQNNTWGALSLDHVFEFMGGMNLSVRQITGKDPDAYLSDYRNRNNVRIQEVKEAIGVESRTTLFNPTYIREQMKGGSTAAAGITELVQNTFGWEVMKPEAIDDEMWHEIYDTYVSDKYDLNVRDFFESKSPAALQDITAIMLEATRKGMWKAGADQVATLVKLHTELVQKHEAACTEFVCDNSELRKYVAGKVDAATAQAYNKKISAVRDAVASKEGKLLDKHKVGETIDTRENLVSGVVAAVVAIAVVVALVMLVRHRRRQTKN